MLTILKRLAADELGATAIEYGVFAAVFAIGPMTAFSALGQSLDTTSTWSRRP
jgi:pilus assembly protein Flp/PilA